MCANIIKNIEDMMINKENLLSQLTLNPRFAFIIGRSLALASVF
jgi:hypothetical protein